MPGCSGCEKGCITHCACAARKGQGLLFSASEWDRLIGLVVKVSTSRAEDPGFESRLCQGFPGVESY